MMFSRNPRLMMTEEDTSGSGGGGGGGTLPAAGGQPGLEGGGAGGGGTPEWASVPKSWAAEHHPHWEAVPEPVRQIIHKRESDVERGIRTYADGHGRWSKLTGVFKEVLSQNPQLNVEELYTGLAQNHLALVRATPEQRREMFKTMAKHYGVEFAEAAAGQQGAQAAANEGELPPAVLAKLGEVLTPLVEKVKQFETFTQSQQQEKMRQVVDAFFSDPKNKYVKDVGPAMAELLNSRKAPDLQSAYDLAVLANPAIRAKYLADLAEVAAGGQGTENPPAGPELKSSAAPATTGKPKTMDDTMEAVAMKAFPGWKPRKSTV